MEDKPLPEQFVKALKIPAPMRFRILAGIAHQMDLDQIQEAHGKVLAIKQARRDMLAALLAPDCIMANEDKALALIKEWRSPETRILAKVRKARADGEEATPSPLPK